MRWGSRSRGARARISTSPHTRRSPLRRLAKRRARLGAQPGARGVDFRPALADLSYKAAAFEGIRLLYQPFLAKLQIVEKSSLGGISPWDVRRNQREFDFI